MKTHLFRYSNNNSCCAARTVCFSALLLLLVCGALAADVPEMLPGREVRFTAPKSKKDFLVYVPVDYTDKRAFPVMFYYHGLNGTATTAMFRRITKGQGFIIVGMNYATHAYYRTTRLSPTATAPEKLFFKEVLAMLSDRLNIATDYIFMGGYSQGGYSTTVLGEQLLDQLAGRLVLGAGRRDFDVNPPPAELIRGHPVFFGVGELDDPHYPRAKRAAQFYKKLGADVTFEGWPDETHKFTMEVFKITKMREWLIAYGPAKQVETGFKAAEAAEKDNRLGEALVLYDQIKGILPDTELCRLAEKSVARLATHANTQLALIKKAADEKPHAELVKRLETLRDAYSGSIFAERAAQVLRELLNAKADALEKRARAAETEKDYARALQLYKLYLSYFTEAERYPEVKKHVKELKNKTGIK
jgi:predicted esterase